MDDFLFRGDLADLDPDVAALVDLEALRQAKRLILIPSEASVPAAVRQAASRGLRRLRAFLGETGSLGLPARPLELSSGEASAGDALGEDRSPRGPV